MKKNINIIFYYLSYLFYVLKIPIEVKKGKVSLFLAQVLWIFNRSIGVKIYYSNKIFRDYYETTFGKFFVPRDLISSYAISPSFERQEINMLMNIIEKERKKNKNILFIDIGAFCGLYSVAIGNKFRRYKKLKIIAIEPGTEYLTQSTTSLLKRNIKLNKLSNVEVINCGIWSSNKKIEGVNYKTLDKILSKKDLSFDVVFIKLDIDDYVIEGLHGIQASVEKFPKAILLVEDFVKYDQVIKYLKKHKYLLMEKKSPYNSFWKYKL